MNLNDTEQVINYVDSVRRADSDFFVRVQYLYKHPDPAVRLTVADILANSHDPEAKKYLRELIFDSNRIVQQRASRFFCDDGFNLDELLKEDRTKFGLPSDNKSESQPDKQKVSGQQTNIRRRNRRRTLKKGLGLQVPTELSDFVLVEGTNYMVTKDFLFPRVNWRDTHYALAGNHLFMPRIDIFLEHYKQFIAAINGQGNLYDGNRVRINDRQLKEIEQNRTNHYFHLDAIFDDNTPTTNHRVIDGKLVGKSQPLIQCLNPEGYADFTILTSQGLPIRLAEPRIYDAPKVMGYVSPYNDDEEHSRPTVGLFSSFENMNTLFCTGSPESKFLAQGVLGCRCITVKNPI